jgi:hypothetical protein
LRVLAAAHRIILLCLGTHTNRINARDLSVVRASMEAAKRRSRMRRTSAGKRIEITERDIELFKLLARYRYLRSNFLYSFLEGDSETRFKERLGHLYHDGRYIDRPAQQWEFANSRYMPVVYELDDKGEQVLRDLGFPKEDRPLVKNGRAGAYRQFGHQLMICECIGSIELGVRKYPNLRFVSWEAILEKAPGSTRALPNPFDIPVAISQALPYSGQVLEAEVRVVPDELFGLEYTNGESKTYRFFALEADRGTMPTARSDLRQTSYLRKILAYREIAARGIYKSHLGLPNLVILNVTTDEQRMSSIMSVVQSVAHEGKSKLFLFKTINGPHDDAPASPGRMLTDPWERVGYEPAYIDH